MLSLLTHKMHSFSRRRVFEQAWFFPTWLLLGFSRLAILTVPFRSLSHYLGQSAESPPWTPLLTLEEESRAIAIARVVRLAARYTPWVSNCFSEAVTARILLGLWGIPYCLFFGTRTAFPDLRLEAHAWLVAGRITVTGGKGFDHFNVIACFAAAKP